MKVLFVWPICTFSVWDVARGYRAAFARALGEENVRDYKLNHRTEYHRRALAPTMGQVPDVTILAKQASEGVLAEALYFNADVVFIVSGLNFHPIGSWLLHRVGIHASVVLTESPYDDVNQADFVSAHPTMTVFTNERSSARNRGWNYLPHAYDPDVHKPSEPDMNSECDVLMVGTGWEERQALLEAVDWTGIDVRLYGVWPTVTDKSPIHKFIWPVCVDNTQVPAMYSGAKIGINLHRSADGAESLNPRLYEGAACGMFQLSDWRPELDEVFDGSIPTFTSAERLEAQIRYYLTHDPERRALAAAAREAASACTFDQRAAGVLAAIQRDLDRNAAARMETTSV